LIFQVLGKVAMAKCTKCGADIASAGYDTEELKLPNDTSGEIIKKAQRVREYGHS
jgi:hypothetical protein